MGSWRRRAALDPRQLGFPPVYGLTIAECASQTADQISVVAAAVAATRSGVDSVATRNPGFLPARSRVSRRILAICMTIGVVVPITALAVADAASTAVPHKPSAEKVEVPPGEILDLSTG